MSGNVWEWNWDWYGTYPTGAVTDYRGAPSGAYRLFHGGSRGDGASAATVSMLGMSLPYNRVDLAWISTPPFRLSICGIRGAVVGGEA